MAILWFPNDLSGPQLTICRVSPKCICRGPALHCDGVWRYYISVGLVAICKLGSGLSPRTDLPAPGPWTSQLSEL